MTELTKRGLERRIKRHLNMKLLSFAAITVPGFEQVTRFEIEQLESVSVTGVERGIVEFTGPMEVLYNAHLYLRTVNRILLRITHFTARSYPELYNKAGHIDWELYCGFAEEISFTVSSRSSRLHHTANIASTVFDALQHHQQKLNVPTRLVKDALIRFFIRFCNDICVISMDASGTLLYKRGFRPIIGKAPLRETTAAALLNMASWKKYRVIADPCCGSGGIILEALHMACHRAPGIHRTFSFFLWPSFNPIQWERLRRKAAQKKASNDDLPLRLIANDIDEAAVQMTRANYDAFTPHPTISVELTCRDCFIFNRNGEYGHSGLLISNLPFGKRVQTDDNDGTLFYRKLGEWLNCFCHGWHYAFLVADPLFEKKAGISSTTVCSFNHGGIPVRFITGYIAATNEKIVVDTTPGVRSTVRSDISRVSSD